MKSHSVVATRSITLDGSSQSYAVARASTAVQSLILQHIWNHSSRRMASSLADRIKPFGWWNLSSSSSLQISLLNARYSPCFSTGTNFSSFSNWSAQAFYFSCFLSSGFSLASIPNFSFSAFCCFSFSASESHNSVKPCRLAWVLKRIDSPVYEGKHPS